jgi:NAD(P)-dependent dehydrogenase (short-subunit alcohol dehydrogenase family)
LPITSPADLGRLAEPAGGVKAQFAHRIEDAPVHGLQPVARIGQRAVHDRGQRIVFNNGAFAVPGAVEDLPRDALRFIFETNLFGVHDLTVRLIPHFRRQGFGRVVNCSSVLGFTALKWRGAYVATKFAMEGLTDVLRLEMRDTPVKVVLIEPGPITSRIRANSIPHFERFIDWEASPRAEQYRSVLLKRLYKGEGKDTFELPASAVSQVLARAMEARNPAPRYLVTTPTWIMAAARRLLPTRALDALAARI